MNTIIERILIFKNDNDKREVKFNSGLNIITGDSKTGKSALIEIIDYCLFSSRSTIPKGKIEEYATLFAIILKISDKYLLIGRENPKKGDGNRVYIKVETTDEYFENINLSYFTESDSKTLKDAQYEVESHLGIAVDDTRIDEDEEKRKAGKVTLRSFVPLLLQHQNLIANKHSIFYRFNDFYKRKKTISDFPILIGWENSEYFSILREIEILQKELKAQEKLINSLKLKDDELKEELKSLISNYYKIIGLELEEDVPLTQLKKISANLPIISEHSYADSNIDYTLNEKEKQRKEFKDKLSEVESLLKIINDNSENTFDYAKQLSFLAKISEKSQDETNFICPVCKKESQEMKEGIEVLNQSKDNLLLELSKIGSYKRDKEEQINSLRTQRNELKHKIIKLSSEITKFEQTNNEIKEKNSLRDHANILKGETEANLRHLLNQNKIVTKNIDLNELKGKISALREKIDDFDLKYKISDAEKFLAESMTSICNNLDFENELKPGKFRFSIEDFDFYYHYNNKEKIYLSEMGSGANWLSSHLALFLSLLHLNCTSQNSSIPSFLILDQPSQVYFPKNYRELDDDESKKIDENIKQVKNIFSVIANEIKRIKKECGFEPQVIVLEHADEPEFEDCIIKRWNKDNRLI